MAISGHLGEVYEKIINGKYPRRKQNLVGEQWELADASAIGGFPRPVKTIVCKPPLISSKDILRPELIESCIKNPDYYAENMLSSILEDRPLWSKDNIVDAFNQLLESKGLFKHFKNAIDFQDLDRTDKGFLGKEKRIIPQDDNDLNAYQAIRVNRLILESVFGSSLLNPGVYLNTQGVVADIFNQMRSEQDIAIEKILVFCHPSHLFWCGYNTALQVLNFQDEMAFDADLITYSEHLKSRFKTVNELVPDIRAKRVDLLEVGNPIYWGEAELSMVYDPTAAWCWDPGSAQIWTRSKENFDKYNAM